MRLILADLIHAKVRAQSQELEIITGIETLKSMGAEDRAIARWSNAFVDSMNAELERGRVDALSDSLLATLRFAAPRLTARQIRRRIYG